MAGEITGTGGSPQPANKQTLRFWLAAKKGAPGCGATSQDSGTNRMACVSAQLSRLARRNGCSPRRTAETDASCQHLDHDEGLWRSLHGIEARSQHIRRATRAAQRSHLTAKGRRKDGLCFCASNLLDHFRPQSKIRISRNPMMALVAVVGFEPTTFGL